MFFQVLIVLAVSYTSSVLGTNYNSNLFTPYYEQVARQPGVVDQKSEYLVDTHEVETAKIKHQTTLHTQSYHNGNDEGHVYDYDSTPYEGPFAKSHVLEAGYSADTQEVAAAKNKHQNIVDESYLQRANEEHHITPYQGPLAKPHVLESGYLADTQEVVAAKKNHQEVLENQSYQQGEEEEHNAYNHHSTPYHGPLVKPLVLQNGYLAGTPEVVAAKNNHQAVLENQSYHHGDEEEHNTYNHQSTPYHGPLVKPVLLKNGYLADTHEVAVAKNAHQTALKTFYHHGKAEEHEQYSHDDHGDLKYHGPTTFPHVLDDGHIADTREVAAAKKHHLAAVAKARHHGESSRNQGYDHYGNSLINKISN